MNVSIIAAVANHRVIGKGKKMLWKLPADLRYFRDQTIRKKHIIMGKNTYESIGHPLIHRTNIVITRHNAFKDQGILIARSLEDALKIVSDNGADEAMVIGGAGIYDLALPLTNTLYITRVWADFLEGDIFFPALNEAEWRLESIEQHQADIENLYDYSFCVFQRV